MQAKRIINKTMKLLLTTSDDDSPQHIIVKINDFLQTEYSNKSELFDPYAELKKKSNIAVLNQFDYLESMVKNSPSSLEEAVKNAAAGNIIDFGAKDHGSINIEHEIQNIPSLQFSIYDFEPFLTLLNNAHTILYIGDNAGEIVFDRILIRQIKRHNAHVRIIFATRDKPIINDVTLQDAYMVGLDKDAEIISSGSIYPGLMLATASDAFRNLWNDADLIIAKGQGNYEGLSNENDSRLFFILRIKCERVAEDIGATTGDLVLWQNNNHTNL